jgi:predicted RNA binding protein YcfA (HicA-like mRNA interferase family)
MSARQKLLLKIISGSSDGNIEFTEMSTLLQHLGFTLRIKGSHHIFSKADVAEILNLQPQGQKCKNYQVKQIRALLIKYKLAGEVTNG